MTASLPTAYDHAKRLVTSGTRSGMPPSDVVMLMAEELLRVYGKRPRKAYLSLATVRILAGRLRDRFPYFWGA